LVFYQDQWKALVGILVDYILLGAALAYRRIYVDDQAEEAARADDAAEGALERALLKAVIEAGIGPKEAA
jgi:hypothetical protein